MKLCKQSFLKFDEKRNKSFVHRKSMDNLPEDLNQENVHLGIVTLVQMRPRSYLQLDKVYSEKLPQILYS